MVFELDIQTVNICVFVCSSFSPLCLLIGSHKLAKMQKEQKKKDKKIIERSAMVL
jgi:hypothetical protein